MSGLFILGVRIDNVSREQALQKVLQFLQGHQLKTIWTPNPEMLVAAARLPAFSDVLNHGDLNICDGSGISLITGKKLQRIHGVDFAEDVCRIAQAQGYRIFLLGSGDADVINQAVSYLNRNFPRLEIVGVHPGPRIEMNNTNEAFSCTVDEHVNKDVLDAIQRSAAHILLVGFGHMKQELWIHCYASRCPTLRVAMGVGGTFDIWGGKRRRAPQLVRWLHLEWFWRLILEPKRFTRIVTATIIFPFLCFRNR